MKNSINLLPIEFRRRTLMSTRFRQWITTFAICAGAGLFVAGIQWQQLGARKAAVASQRAKAKPFRKMEQTLVEMQDELTKLHASRSLLAEARRSTQPITLLGLVSRSANENLQVNTFDFSSEVNEKPPATKDKKAAPETVVVTKLVLEGIADDNLAISKMLAGLKSGQIFESVEVMKISETVSEKSPVRSYSITCRIGEDVQ